MSRSSIISASDIARISRAASQSGVEVSAIEITVKISVANSQVIIKAEDDLDKELREHWAKHGKN